MSLFQTNLSMPPSERHASSTIAFCCSSEAPPIARSFSRTHSSSDASLDEGLSGRRSAIVSARSPTAWYDSSNNQSDTCDSSIAHVASNRTGTSRLGLPPLRNQTAHAASAGSACVKYLLIASTFSFVRVVASISENSLAKFFIQAKPRHPARRLPAARFRLLLPTCLQANLHRILSREAHGRPDRGNRV